MKREDLLYLCTTIGNLSGIPLRLYQDGELAFYYALVDLPTDPMDAFRQDIWAIESHVGYYVTTFFDYYGIVNAPPYKLVIGPTRQVESTQRELRAQALAAKVPSDKINLFVDAMQNIVRMPLDSILQMLCTVNFVLNHERVRLEELMLSMPELPFSEISRKIRARYPEDRIQLDLYTSYAVEKQLMDMIRHGDVAAFQTWASSAPAIRSGIMSADQLRQHKNIFIVSAALASRAAIEGGLDGKTSFFLSDGYIQQCELLKSPAAITALQYQMILDYAERVQNIRAIPHPTALSLQIARYVQDHLSESIPIDAVAKEVGISRSRLTERFKAETGITVNDFILQTKIKEAKKLLCYSEISICEIGNYLGFSSQSHFTRVFRKYTSQTPGEYRKAFCVAH